MAQKTDCKFARGPILPDPMFCSTTSTSCEAPGVDFFPLKGSLPRSVKEKLCRILFNWPICPDCQNTGQCIRRGCAWRGFDGLAPFFEFYRTTTAWSLRQNLFEGPKVIKCHEDILYILDFLIKRPNDSRADLLRCYFADQNEKLDYLDQVRAFNLAFRLRTMVQCSLRSSPLISWRPGFEPAGWACDISQRTFLASAFPIREVFSLNDDYGATMRFQLAAKRLVGNLKIQGTDDLRKHILLDRERRILYIYHHTGFLKESLRASRDRNCDELDGILRQLAVETIDTIQKIFFPLDAESRKLLSRFISQGFDPDTAEYYPDDYRRANEHNHIYRHWGSRLIQLHEFVKNQTPSRGFWIWCRRWSRKEHLMLVTLLGVLVAVVSIIQSWVTSRTGPMYGQIGTSNGTGIGRLM